MATEPAVREAIVECVVQFMYAFDAKDWVLMRSLLADPVHCDYSALRGTPPGPVAADAYVAERQRSLSALAMQHNVTNFLVEGAGAAARCRCNYQIFRFAAEPGAAAARHFHSFGRYHFELDHAAGRWRIRAIRQELVASWGDRDLHPGAGPRD